MHRPPSIRPRPPVVLRRFAWRFVPLIVLCAAVLSAVHMRERAQDRELARAHARGVLAVQHRMLDRELGIVVSILRYLASQSTVAAYVAGGASRDAVERDFLALCERSALFDQVRILDADGMETVRIDFDGGRPVAVPADELQSKADRYYFRIARELGPLEAYVSPFDLNVEHGEIETPWKPVIRLLTKTSSGGGSAVVVLNYLGSELLGRLRAAAEQIVGWSALVSGEGHYLEGPSKEVSWGFMFDAPPTFAAAQPRVWEDVQALESGTVLTPEGMFAFRAFLPGSQAGRHRSDLDLSLVTFTPNRILYADSARLLRVLLMAASALLLLLAAGIWRIAFEAEVRAAHEERLEQSEQHLRDLSTRLLDAQETERRKLSRDLHDELGQIATAVTIDLKQAQRYPERRDELLERALGGVDKMLQSVREMSSRLRTSLLDDLGLRDALVEHCAEFAERSELAVDVVVEVEEDALPEGGSIHVFRIVQESLNNVLRHAQASSVRVRVQGEDDGVSIVVTDDGSGFDADGADGASGERARSLGLAGMRERVELLAGHLEISSEPRRGTTVRAWIPGRAGGAPGETPGQLSGKDPA